MKIVDTDNFGGDYPNEKVVASNITNKLLGEIMVKSLNRWSDTTNDYDRYYKLVEDNYKLVPGFEP